MTRQLQILGLILGGLGLSLVGLSWGSALLAVSLVTPMAVIFRLRPTLTIALTTGLTIDLLGLYTFPYHTLFYGLSGLVGWWFARRYLLKRVLMTTILISGLVSGLYLLVVFGWQGALPPDWPITILIIMGLAGLIFLIGQKLTTQHETNL